MLAGVRSNTPQLFPPDVADFTDRVRDARANVRALAFVTAVTSGAIKREVILKSQGDLPWTAGAAIGELVLMPTAPMSAMGGKRTPAGVMPIFGTPSR